MAGAELVALQSIPQYNPEQDIVQDGLVLSMVRVILVWVLAAVLGKSQVFRSVTTSRISNGEKIQRAETESKSLSDGLVFGAGLFALV